MGETAPNVVWKPQPKQARALSCPVFELFYGGAAGGGKTDFLLIDFLHGTEHGAAHSGIHFRRSFTELKDTMKRARELYTPLGAVSHEQGKTWTFPKGATLRFAFLDSEDDVQIYQNEAFTWIGWDQLTTWPTDYAYIWMMTRVRSAHGVPCRARAAGNPGGVGHLWVKARFIDACPPEQIYFDSETQLKRVFIPARLEDNLRLMSKDPDYDKRLRMNPDYLYRAYRYGDWDIFAGQVFSEWRRDLHVVKPYPLKPTCYRFASMDWGYAKPFSVGWWAIDHDGRITRYREWYGCEQGKHNVGIKMPAKEVAKKAWDLSVAEGCADMVADPASWNKQDEVLSPAERFAEAGFRMVRGNNARVQGWQHLHELLKLKGMDGAPMLQVFDTCTAFIRILPILSADAHNAEDVDTKQEDHVADETRYAIMSELALRTARTQPPRRPGKRARTDWDPLTEGA